MADQLKIYRIAYLHSRGDGLTALDNQIYVPASSEKQAEEKAMEILKGKNIRLCAMGGPYLKGNESGTTEVKIDGYRITLEKIVLPENN